MKRQVKETLCRRNRGTAKLITYGYDTKIEGLAVVRTIDALCKEFVLIHEKSGLSIGVHFLTVTGAMEFANKYLTGFDFILDKEALMRDNKLSECIKNAIAMQRD